MGEEEWAETWNLFDRPPRKQVLPKDTVKHCIRGIGRLYEEADLDALLSGSGETVTKEEYLEALRKPYSEPEHTVTSAARAYDGKESGQLPEQLLLKVFSETNPKPSERELEQMMYGLEFCMPF
eukprot:TRINITY_DN9306_c0_g1_i2.p1 TRINITY_DN9306_c0_g1~~TRINITY_DN9306_c0_g1_i2.p1  ORF type:complete len:124 (+),score=14.03 TRINITY_DN9306_c0_g1_i2:41-412(+)